MKKTKIKRKSLSNFVFKGINEIKPQGMNTEQTSM